VPEAGGEKDIFGGKLRHFVPQFTSKPPAPGGMVSGLSHYFLGEVIGGNIRYNYFAPINRYFSQ
jgi:hypothetical protein